MNEQYEMQEFQVEKKYNKLELLSDIILSPENAFKKLKLDRNTSVPILALIFGYASMLTSGMVVHSKGYSGTGFFNILFLSILFMITASIIAASYYHLTSEAFRGEGKILDLISMFWLSFGPGVILLPASLILKFADFYTNGIFYFIYIIIISWILALALKSLKVNYKTGYLKAAFIFFSPLFAGILIILLIFAFSLTTLISLIF